MNSDGMSVQSALLRCELVSESRVTGAGAGEQYYLKLGDMVVPIGTDHDVASRICSAIKRNAEAFEHAGSGIAAERERCAKIADSHKGSYSRKVNYRDNIRSSTPEALVEIRAEERGEDIAAEIIARRIRTPHETGEST